MSFLTALLTGFGGYGQGVQQRTQNKQSQDQIDAQKAYQNSEIALRQRQQADVEDTASRARGVDPATGKPFILPQALTQVVPGNKGKPATTQDQYNHFSAVARWAYSNGYTDMGDYASGQAKDLLNEMTRAQAEAAQNQRDIFNQGEQDRRTAETVAGAMGRTVLTTDTSRANNEDTTGQSNINNLRTTTQSDVNSARTAATSRSNTLANINQRASTQTDLFMRGYEAQNARAKADADKSGNAVDLPYPNLDAFKQNLSANIASVAQNPKSLPGVLKALDAHAKDYDPEWIQYAEQKLTEAAQAASAAQDQPGVPRFLPPPRPAPRPQ
jgi:hypothetical protein